MVQARLRGAPLRPGAMMDCSPEKAGVGGSIPSLANLLKGSSGFLVGSRRLPAKPEAKHGAASSSSFSYL